MYGRHDFRGGSSLALCLCGLLFLALCAYGVRFTPAWMSSRLFYGTYLAGLFLELAAVGFGLAGRDSGKARLGLALSLLSLVLFVGLCCSVIALAGMGGTGVHG